MSFTYDSAFFDRIRETCRSSAAVVVPVLFTTFQPHSVVDLGCGEGWWLREFEQRGCEAIGVDGEGVEPVIEHFVTHDLEQPLPDLGRRFDLALSLEVAEHLPESRADDHVAELCALAPTVVFSAAVPGQGGTGHLNERWPDYWAEKFGAHGYQGSGALRWYFWDDERVAAWYRQNTLVFGKHELANDGCPAVIHPEVFARWQPAARPNPDE